MAKLKRFYQEVSVVAADDGFEVLLDGKPLRSPEQNALDLPSALLSEAVAEEWRAQANTIVPDTMPFTRFAFTAADRVAPNREAVIEQISAFANSDVVCYRASAPSDLVERQMKSWDPLLEWAETELGAAMRTGEGIGYVAQDYEALCALTEAFCEESNLYLAALYTMVSNAGSLIIGLAVAEQMLDVEEAFRSANCDELYQAEKWGTDEDAVAQIEARKAEFKSAAQFLDLLRGPAQINGSSR
jgi:chaperone required for assembly of F1-ATPase